MTKKILSIICTALMLTGCSLNPEAGPQGEQGLPGEPGVSIVSITKVSSEDNVDTYKIILSDGSSSSFTILNGKDGLQGIQGLPGENGHTPTISINNDGYWNTTEYSFSYKNLYSYEDVGSPIDVYISLYQENHVSVDPIKNKAVWKVYLYEELVPEFIN